MLTNFYNVSKYIKDNNQKVAALFREVRLLFMIIFVCPLYKSSYDDSDSPPKEKRGSLKNCVAKISRAFSVAAFDKIKLYVIT